jgi:hypothetical protein
MTSVSIDGADYEVAHTFSSTRLLVNYDGLFVLVDRDPASGAVQLSGTPATPDEAVVMKQFVQDATTVTISK